MRKKVMGVAWSFLLLALGSDAPLQAQTTPRFFLDRMVEVQGFAPQAGDEAREAGRESALLRKLEAKAGTAAVRLPASPRFSPRPGERLWVFYGSACRGSAVVKGLKAQKVPGPIPARAWFELDASSLPATVNGNGHWLERAVYLEARPSDKEPAPAPDRGLRTLPEYASQQLFTRMLRGLSQPPPDWRVKRWMTEWNYGQSFVSDKTGISWLVLRYKYPTKETNQAVLCRVGDRLMVWDRLRHNRIEQAFQWRGKTYVALLQTGRGVTWSDLYRLDEGKLTWITGHRLPEDPSLDEAEPEFPFQQNSKGYIAD